MKKEGTGGLDQLTEGELAARIKELDTQAKPLEEDRKGLRERITGLRRQLGLLLEEDAQLEARLDGPNKERREIRDRLDRIEELRNEAKFAQLVKEYLQRDGEILGKSDIPMVQNLGRVIGRIATDEGFAAVLPKLLEPTFVQQGPHKGFSNSDRIRVQASNGDCRIILYDWGGYSVGYGIVYTQKPQTRAVLQYTPAGYIAQGHFLGIWISPKNPSAVQFFTLGLNKESRGKCDIPLSPPQELLNPILDRLARVLAQGEIQIPQKFGHARIHPISR